LQFFRRQLQISNKRRRVVKKFDFVSKFSQIGRLTVDTDIHGYIHVLDFNHPMDDISMDIVLSHLLIKLNI